jgi:hypothetical protein
VDDSRSEQQDSQDPLEAVDEGRVVPQLCKGVLARAGEEQAQGSEGSDVRPDGNVGHCGSCAVSPPCLCKENGDVHGQLRKDSCLLQNHYSDLAAGLGSDGCRHGLPADGGMEGALLIAVEFVFQVVVGCVAVVVGTREGPNVARVIEGGISVVVLCCGGGKVQLDQEVKDGQAANDEGE